ncbi:MAG: RNA polymerase subunit sigma-24 [Verrucomicrobia bacterium]|nr:MAG: RNA polymerase subunit sigma-24 [Verrucomicrobiota bacterium]
MPPLNTSQPDEISDTELMTGVQAGHEECLQALIERHQTRVIGIVVQMLGDESEAEDLAQQVFVRVWKSAKRYVPTARFTSWLLTITRNLTFNEIRRRQRCKLVAGGAEMEQTMQPLEDVSVLSPAQKILDWEMQEMIQAAIERLPKPQRLALVLRRYEELPYEDIAQILGTSLPAVKSMLFRAREELKHHVRRYLSC